MKTKITLLLLTLFSFVSNTYSQTITSSMSPECIVGSCGAQDVTIGNVYVGDNLGASIATCNINDTTPTQVFLWASITASSKYNLYVQYNLKVNGTYVNIDGSPVTSFSANGKPSLKHSISIPGQIADQNYKFIPINYICGQVIELKDVYFTWTANSNDTPGCQSPQNSKCSNRIPDFIVNTPIAADFNYTACNNGANTTVTFANTSTGGNILHSYNYAWDFDNDGITDSTQKSPEHTYANPGPYTAKLTVSQGGNSNTYQELLVFPNQLAGLTLTPSPTSCNGSSGSITASGLTGGNGSYTYSIDGGTNYQANDTFNGLSSGPYTVIAKDGNGCTISASTSVVVSSGPTVVVNGPIEINCSNTSAALDGTGSETSGVTYAWSTSDGTFSGDTNAITATVTTPGTYTLTVTKTATGCAATSSVTVTQPAPIEPIIPEAECNTDRTSTINLNNYLPTDTPLTGSWTNDRSIVLIDNEFKPYNLPIGEYNFEYKVMIESCLVSYVVKITIINQNCGIVLGCGDIEVHNAFTPNNDGVNDSFEIDNIDDVDCYPENTVEIYNRWGVLVFETKNYNNTTNNFNGISRGRTTISQSSGLPTGTYYYILNYSSVDNFGKKQTNKKDGYLYLTR